MKNNLNIIVNSIIKEGKLFFINDMNIELIDIVSVENVTLSNHIGLIELSGKQKVVVAVSIDDNLFSTLFDKFFSVDLDNDEKIELENEFANEILNTIVGLSMRHFSSNSINLVLQPPLDIKKEELSKMLHGNRQKNIRISTVSGNLYFIIFLSSS